MPRISLKGIGPKAADCILLYAFQMYEAFPVDVWIRRIMTEHYPIPSKVKNEYERISRFARKYFGHYAGYAQEYLFCSRSRG
jgi:N-glycosylase/DNA lyase